MEPLLTAGERLAGADGFIHFGPHVQIRRFRLRVGLLEAGRHFVRLPEVGRVVAAGRGQRKEVDQGHGPQSDSRRPRIEEQPGGDGQDEQGRIAEVQTPDAAEKGDRARRESRDREQEYEALVRCRIAQKQPGRDAP